MTPAPTRAARHCVLLHPTLSFSGVTERLAATALALQDQGNRVTVLSTPGSRAPALAAAGVELKMVELPRRPGDAPFAFLRLKKCVRGLEPNLLHATDESLAPTVAALARSLHLPYVLEVQHQVNERLPHAGPWLAAAIATSESLVEGMVNHGRLSREKIRVVRHAPRPLDESGAQPFDHDGAPRVGCAGYLDQRHNTEWFLEAARTLVRSDRRYTFLVLGEGPREVSLRRSIREANLTEHVTLGVPTTTRTAQTLATLDVYVSCRVAGGPSWISCSALAQGLPSIFAAAGEAFHLVRDRHSGVLTEPGDGRRLAEEITLMVENPDFARAMGLRGRDHVLETLPPDRFERELAEIHAIASGAAVTR